MAISYIDKVSAAGTTATWPAHQIGDLLLVFAYRNSSGAPILASGYTHVATADNGSIASSCTVGYKIATSTSDAFGTWSFASIVGGLIYRGAYGVGASAATAKTASTTAGIPGLSLNFTDGTSWVAAFSGSRANGTQDAATGMTFRGGQTGTTAKISMNDTDGGVSSFVATSAANGGSNVASVGASIEIVLTAPSAGGGQIKVWNGSSFTAKPVKYWNGSAWGTKPVKYWNGSAWVATNY